MKNNNQYIFIPETDALLFGENENFTVDLLSNELKNNEYKEFFIDLRKKTLISSEGISFIISLIEKIRELDIYPYIISSLSMSVVLKNTLLGKIIRIENNFYFERENSAQVEELEKDMLWNFF